MADRPSSDRSWNVEPQPSDPGPDPPVFQHEILALLRAALDGDGFVTHAEPIVDLASGDPREHELTLRLPAGGGRLIEPSDFEPVAERFGLMPDVDDLLIRRAVDIAGDGHAVAVDVGGASLADPGLTERTEQTLAEGHADPGLVTFELAEGDLTAEAAAATAFVHRMHELGCNITGDHFGTGAAGFGYLEGLVLDCLKIDASFIADLRTAPSDEQFVRAFVHLARGLEVATAAEGVPDEATRSLLADAGVDEGQGSCFGVPAPLPPGGLAPDTSQRGAARAS